MQQKSKGQFRVLGDAKPARRPQPRRVCFFAKEMASQHRSERVLAAHRNEFELIMASQAMAG